MNGNPSQSLETTATHLVILPTRIGTWLSCIFLAIGLVGCATDHRSTKLNHFANGTFQLRPIEKPEGWSDWILQAAANRHEDEGNLTLSLQRSLAWINSSAGRSRYRMIQQSELRDHVARSLEMLLHLLTTSTDDDQLARAITEQFELYGATLGDRSLSPVLFTGYFAPAYPARQKPDDRFRYPLYRWPADWNAHDQAGDSPPTRQQIHDDDILAGNEIAWLDDALNVYLIQVNGSAQLQLADGTAMCVGYSHTNGLSYTSLGKLLINAGRSTLDEMSMQRIRELYDDDPTYVQSLMLQNDRFVFFRELPAEKWPRSSLGITVTPMRSIATDKSVYWPGAIAFAHTQIKDMKGELHPFTQFVSDQDSGGAIVGPGRCDIYMGVGESAGAVAGRIASEGQLLYLLLRDPKSVQSDSEH